MLLNAGSINAIGFLICSMTLSTLVNVAHADICGCFAAGWRFGTVTLLAIGHRWVHVLQDVVVCTVSSWREPRRFTVGEKVRLRHCYVICCKTVLFDDAGEAHAITGHVRKETVPPRVG